MYDYQLYFPILSTVEPRDSQTIKILFCVHWLHFHECGKQLDCTVCYTLIIFYLFLKVGSTYTCNNGQVIPSNSLCDLFNDCADCSDEKQLSRWVHYCQIGFHSGSSVHCKNERETLSQKCGATLLPRNSEETFPTISGKRCLVLAVNVSPNLWATLLQNQR